ncbi:outer dense fiber protein 3-like [Nematolebias whitei]|uniref:outer dense fiber protein 3-like n=1 Tax=Nematolebias whitei TaxID=451745 RepID=UPI0018998BEE|nr:outer dense fiber protein 3-like [Nematolebias whitei]
MAANLKSKYYDNEEPNDGVWCGTWRPAKRRGPISAMSQSPGPKYLLPGLTGAIQHDPTKCRAPMYTFGLNLNVEKTDCSPGPKYLLPSNVTRYGKDGTPAFSLHGSLKHPEKFQVPGPGLYSPENSNKLIFPSTPAYSLSGKNKDINKNFTPGPAAYTPRLQTVITPSAPSYTLSGHSKKGNFLEDITHSPGPAAYNAADPYISGLRPPQYSIGARRFHPDKSTNTPGPGAYSPEKYLLPIRRFPLLTN